MTDHDKFDRLLDKALSEFGNVSPRDGLEQRLLARLAAEPERRWNWRWMWAAAPVMAAILIVIFLWTRPAPKHDNNIATAPPIKLDATVPRIASVSPPTPEPQVLTASPRHRVGTTATLAHNESRSPQPKLATFPSPDDNEQQARMLLRFVTRTPGEAAQVASEQQEFQKLAEARMNQDFEDRSER